MKYCNLVIDIKSLDKGLDDFRAAAAKLSRKEAVKPKSGVYFVSLDAVRQVLSPKRVELLRAVRERRPRSLYELARILARNFKNVQADVAMLMRIGLIKLSREKDGRERATPTVAYDALRLQIPIAAAR